ncbi:MAG: exodeoxyribonuclease I, partial [Rhodoferax sp.]|nr:exodeoxyribonuclease I [Rhodoferax sp.]
ERGCTALMWPLAMHPGNKNELLAWDLAFDPSELASLSVADIRLRLFTKTADLPAGVSRLPIKSVHLNKSPMVMSNLKVLNATQAQRWGIDLALQCERAAVARDLPDMSGVWAEVFKREAASEVDVDEDLYGGFVGNADRRRLNDLRQRTPQELASARPSFDDVRLPELLWRYRARNFPATLSPQEQQRWQAHRKAYLLDGAAGTLTLDDWMAQMDQLADGVDARGEAVLAALSEYVEELVEPLGA